MYMFIRQGLSNISKTKWQPDELQESAIKTAKTIKKEYAKIMREKETQNKIDMILKSKVQNKMTKKKLETKTVREGINSESMEEDTFIEETE